MSRRIPVQVPDSPADLTATEAARRCGKALLHIDATLAGLRSGGHPPLADVLLDLRNMLAPAGGDR